MQPYPHLYEVTAEASAAGDVRVHGAQLPDLATAAPKEFGGPGDRWSPETLLCGAIADCFVLTFRAISRAAKLEWTELDCRVEGRLERVDGVTRFTHFQIHACLKIANGPDDRAVLALLERAEKVCLITNSLNATRTLHIQQERIQ